MSGEINKLFHVQLTEKQMQNLVLCNSLTSLKFKYGFCWNYPNQYIWSCYIVGVAMDSERCGARRFINENNQ